MGADALAELESPIAEVEAGLQRPSRQFTFNDLSFEGFQFGGGQGQGQGQGRSQQSAFQSFPQFTSPESLSLGRARQPIPPR